MAQIIIHADAATPSVGISLINSIVDDFFSVKFNIPGGDQVSIFLDTYEQVVNLRDQLDQALTELTNDLELDKHRK